MKAEILAMALGGRKAGTAWMACCPAHEDRDPSLAITDAKDGGVLLRCHAGCDQLDVIEALRARGLWEAARRHNSGRRRNENRIARTQADSNAMKRTQAALGIWQASRPAEETSVEPYLRSRGLTVPVPPSLRFHARAEASLGWGLADVEILGAHTARRDIKGDPVCHCVTVVGEVLKPPFERVEVCLKVL
jgi:hypothetical protein